MRWNKKKIISKLTLLSTKINSTNEEPLLTILKRDYITILEVLKLIDFERYLYFKSLVNIGNFDYSNYYSAFRRNSANSIIENKEKFISILITTEHYNFSNISLKLIRKMPKDLYLETVREFFKKISNDYYDLYLKLVDEGYIHFARNNQEIGNTKGSCFHLYDSTEAYIVTDFKRNDYVETLPHEVAHAYEFSLLETFSRTVNWQVSTFREAYPRFIEFLFIDFCLEYFQNDKYTDLFIEAKRTLFEGIKAECEYYLNTISNLKSFDSITGKFICKDEKVVSKYFIDLIISDFLGVYMFYLYKKDRNELTQFLDKFEFVKGIDDYLIWDMLDMEKIQEAFKIEASDLKKEMILNRKRKKQGLFNKFN